MSKNTPEQNNELDQLRHILSGDQMGATEKRLEDLEARLSQTDSSPNQRLDQQINDLRKQLADFQAESRKRHSELRQLLVELGQQLRENAGDTAVTQDDSSQPSQL